MIDRMYAIRQKYQRFLCFYINQEKRTCITSMKKNRMTVSYIFLNPTLENDSHFFLEFDLVAKNQSFLLLKPTITDFSLVQIHLDKSNAVVQIDKEPSISCMFS